MERLISNLKNTLEEGNEEERMALMFTMKKGGYKKKIKNSIGAVAI